ncbi:hypothetical protein DOS84_00395 [Flavobacterium aquariorum]|uniref:Uncharacterized protein n=1 Tax=Flavobacterium aquariorum TaxID=2217670 RepID=A0A2W7TX24_9FLAO|nr:hypothetical protein DOS84_00395 [Flavobacterium aquariorum]
MLLLFFTFLIPFVLEFFCKTKQEAAIINSKKDVYGQWYSFDSEWIAIHGKRLFIKFRYNFHWQIH